MIQVTIQPYQATALESILTLFNETVATINRQDYSEAAILQWLQPNPDYQRWQQLLTEEHTLLAYHQQQLVGFASITATGYLDFLYIHKDYVQQGIGRVLVEHLLHYAKEQAVTTISVHASITAKPFFETLGFQLVKELSQVRNGVVLTNYLLTKSLAAAD